MNALHKKRLLLTVLIVGLVASVIFLVLYALRQNINLFYSPSQVVAGEAPYNHIFRMGGLVQVGSVRRSANDLQVAFVVTDHVKTVAVNYVGILPDLFREGQSVVVQGKLSSHGIFVADQVLAKHDEKYMPKQVAAILEKTY